VGVDAETKRILLVEDNPGDVRLLIELLHENGKKQNYSLEHVDRIEKALQRIAQVNFDVLLLDLSLPDSIGLDTVRQICGAAPHLPIIVLTGLEDDMLALESVQTGAQDYLVKGQVNSAGLIRAIRHAVERKKMGERLQYMATHDILTELPNRALFEDRLALSINRSTRNRIHNAAKWEIAVMMIDLDHFKWVNDNFGHPMGDRLLQAVAQRLHGAIRQSDTVARMGGDEFIFIFENVTGQDDAGVVGAKIVDIFSEPFILDGKEIHVTASVGISLYPEDGTDFQTLMQTADIAMYGAKRERNRFCLYGSMEVL